jgi:ferredoxin
MAAKKIGHVIRRPGLRLGDPDIEIRVPEDLLSQPGVPTNKTDVDFYSRNYPLESHSVTFSADREWVADNFEPEESALRQEHEGLLEPLVMAARTSGEIESTVKPVEGKDVTGEIRHRAKELGFGEIGFTKFDRRYIYLSKKKWAKYDHAVCIAFEQDYERTQATPSTFAEFAHVGTYRTMSLACLILADFIRSLGYHAQVHSPTDNSGAYIPMFVEAGLGQLGANGQLLSPHFGSRARLMIISTDAIVTYDKPVDYGMHNFCQKCQVCINRCPGRAISREKVWWRGILKNKLTYERCRPVMGHYTGCGVCMKVCPVQKYGMKPVLEHYIETGEVLGKGTHELEGFNVSGKGYFGPGDLPHFDNEFFNIPHTTIEDYLFKQLKEKVANGEIKDNEEGVLALVEFKQKLESAISKSKKNLKDGKPDEG